jgi:hypothetical protein
MSATILSTACLSLSRRNRLFPRFEAVAGKLRLQARSFESGV